MQSKNDIGEAILDYLHISSQNKKPGYSCECVVGWEGNNCEINPDDCASSPCQNGATCTVIKKFLHATLALLFSFAKDLVNGFMCNCTDGFEGEACETDHDDCQPYPCENNGTCAVRVILYIML